MIYHILIFLKEKWLFILFLLQVHFDLNCSHDGCCYAWPLDQFDEAEETEKCRRKTTPLKITLFLLILCYRLTSSSSLPTIMVCDHAGASPNTLFRALAKIVLPQQTTRIIPLNNQISAPMRTSAKHMLDYTFYRRQQMLNDTMNRNIMKALAHRPPKANMCGVDNKGFSTILLMVGS